MGYAFTRDDVAYLGSAAGLAALTGADRLDLTPKSLLRDLEQLRRAHGDRAAVLVETIRLRRRATAKLPESGEWLFTDDALQQATPTAVARHRAARLAGRTVHDVTCSIGAELAELARVCPAVIGSDLDDVRLAMAAHNLGALPVNSNTAAATAAEPPSFRHAFGRNPHAQEENPGPEHAGMTDRVTRNVLLAKADALAPCSGAEVVIADPARRADGRRTHDPAKLQPPLPDLLDAYAGRDLVVKCAPGLDFDKLGWAGEVEVVSLDGAVREACLWSPGLAESGVTRRATVLSSSGESWSLTDAEADDIPEREPGEWIVDPDGAVVRAGLVRHYAAKHGLWQLDPRIAYVTGDSVPEGVRGFRILDRMDFREKPLRAELHRRNCGPLEILTRGVDIDPDALRAKLKPRGTQPHTLVVTRIGRTATVFICATP
ncbi:class I SAM-dependent methyltransferase [Nocardia sp. NPDC127526]|uniref:class I SAM-dependent methyltransferase n=1 Tax=Nocardia sp. NPDC127526 TaxID=3345393 RepID=UPI00362FB70F